MNIYQWNSLKHYTIVAFLLSMRDFVIFLIHKDDGRGTEQGQQRLTNRNSSFPQLVYIFTQKESLTVYKQSSLLCMQVPSKRVIRTGRVNRTELEIESKS